MKRPAYYLLILILLPNVLSISNYTQTFSNNNNTLKKNFQNYNKANSSLNNMSYIPSENITIINDNDFATQAQKNNWQGNGTKINPYIIQGYYFESFTSENDSGLNVQIERGLIQIRQVHSYFIIQNNFFNSKFGFGDLIYITGSSNVIINNNQFYNNFINYYLGGVHILDSINIHILNNKFFTSFDYNYYYSMNYGLLFSNSNDILTFNNTFNNFPVIVSSTKNDSIINNIMDRSIIYIATSAINLSYNVIKNAEYGIIFNPEGYLSGSLELRKGVHTENNLFTNNHYGIYLLKVNTLETSYINCPGYMECNDLPNDFSGFVILHYGNIAIKHNEFLSNFGKAIYIEQRNDNNTIYGNDFIDNGFSLLNNKNDPDQITSQVFESSLQNVTNYWAFNESGNYWSDYNYQLNSSESIGSTPMQIFDNNTDPFPVLNPFYNKYNYPYSISVQNLEIPLTSVNSLSPQHQKDSNPFDSIIDYSSPIIIIVMLSALVGTSIYTIAEFVQYNNLKKLKRNKNLNFIGFLTKKFNKKKYLINHKEILSDEALEKIDEIIQETMEEK